MKNFFVSLRIAALCAFLLGIVGVGASQSQEKPLAEANSNSCSLNREEVGGAVSQPQQENEEFFIVGCGGFL